MKTINSTKGVSLVARRRCRGALLAAAAALSGGCVFEPTLNFFTSNFDGELFVSVSLISQVRECTNAANTNRFVCTFTPENGGGISSSVSLNGADLSGAQFVDPIIVQLPAAANNLQGSYSHDASNSGDQLVVLAGMRAVRADQNRTISAETGMQLVILELPDGAPTSGEFAFNFNFTMPGTTTSVPVKALFAGRVRAGGSTFYAPLFPCTTDMRAVPSLNIPLTDPGRLPLPLGSVSGCNNVSYSYPSGLPSLIFSADFEPPSVLPN